MASTNYFGNGILNYNFIGTSFNPAPNGSIWFGLSKTVVTAQDVSCSTVTEPAATGYARKEFFNGLPVMNVTGMQYTGKNVGLFVDNLAIGSGAIDTGDIVTVIGVNAGFSVTNIDGTWTLTNVNVSPDRLDFTVTNQPVGATPQTITIGEVRCVNWSISSAGSLYNNKPVTFIKSTAGNPWSTGGAPIMSVFIADNATTGAGNVLEFYTLPAPLIVPELTTVSLPAQSITISQPTSCGTTFAINRILNYNFGNIPYTPDDGASHLWLGLSTTLIDNTGLTSVTEPLAASGYTRMQVDDSNWNPSTGVNPPSGVTQNVDITFPHNTASWGIIQSLFLSDSATRAAGNVLWYKTLSPAIIIQEGTEDIYFNSAIPDITFTMT